MKMDADFKAYIRADGRKGIRNNLLVVYTVECAHHVAREIAFPYRRRGVQVIGFGGCYPSAYAERMLHNLCTHPNTGAVLIISLGCEGFRRSKLHEAVAASGRPVHLVNIQETGGTRRSIVQGKRWVKSQLHELKNSPVTTMFLHELIIGGICGGSDASSGIAGNPAVGRFFDRFVAENGTAIFEETGEMIGLEEQLSKRTTDPALAIELRNTLQKAERYYAAMGHGSFAPGNAEGGLTTIEEKSLSSYSKGGTSRISGILKPGIVPPAPGLYLLDVVPDGPPKFGYPNINDNAEIAELIACGCHLLLFVTGRGSVVGSAVSPVVKITGNPITYSRMKSDMDINAGNVLLGKSTLDDVADTIRAVVADTAAGIPTASEKLGHQEFVLTYKSFEPLGPACLPAM